MALWYIRTVKWATTFKLRWEHPFLIHTICYITVTKHCCLTSILQIHWCCSFPNHHLLSHYYNQTVYTDKQAAPCSSDRENSSKVYVINNSSVFFWHLAALSRYLQCVCERVHGSSMSYCMCWTYGGKEWSKLYQQTKLWCLFIYQFHCCDVGILFSGSKWEKYN